VPDTVNVRDIGAVGDGLTDDTAAIQTAIATARSNQAAVLVPYGRYVVSAELNLAAVDFIGVSTGLLPRTTDPDWPTLLPTSSVNRVLRLGPRGAADVASGFTDRARLLNIKIELTNAPANCVAIGTDFGIANRIIGNVHIRGVVGSVAAKAFTGTKLFSPNQSTNIHAYNVLHNIRILYCNEGLNLNSGNAARLDETVLEQVYVWNAFRFFTLMGQNITMTNCGAQGFEKAFDPVAHAHWVVWAQPLGPGGEETFDISIQGFNIEGMTNIKRPFFFLGERVMVTNARGMDRHADPVARGGAPDYIQVLGANGQYEGPQASHGPVVITGNRTQAGNITGPWVKTNLIPNGNFLNWEDGTDFVNPAAGTPVMRGFVAVHGGSSRYEMLRDGPSRTSTLFQQQSVRLKVDANPVGLTGFKVNLANHYPLTGLQWLDRITIGMLCFVSSAQDTIDGACVFVDDGVEQSSVVSVLKYDGSRTCNAVRQQPGQWHVVFVNHQVGQNPTKLDCAFGLNHDASHVGVGSLNIESVWCYPGWADAYGAFSTFEPRSLDAWRNPVVTGILTQRQAWTPGTIVNGAAASVLIDPVKGADVGDACAAGFSANLGAGVTIGANVDIAGAVRVTIMNLSGSSVRFGAGTVRVVVTKLQ
jgi:hypothetical protein